MKPQIALTATYTVVDELQAKLKAAEARVRELEHSNESKQQALNAAVLARKQAEADAEYMRNEWLNGCTFALRRKRL